MDHPYTAPDRASSAHGRTPVCATAVVGAEPKGSASKKRPNFKSSFGATGQHEEGGTIQKEILINARGKETRIALLENGNLAEVDYESHSHDALVGNIYKGTAKDVLSGLAAFIDVGLGEGENLFLSTKEINTALLKQSNIKRGENFSIQKAVKPGQQLIVQVKRGEIGSKNAQGTTKISLAGRFWIFMPKDNRMGISRRIGSSKERNRLKKLAKSLKRPEEGLIARTAAKGATDDQLERDFNFLLGTWKGIEEKSIKSSPPATLYKGPGFVRAYLRDRLLNDIQKILVDKKSEYNDLMQYLDYLHLADFKDRVEFYSHRQPLFARFGIEEMIQQSLDRSVPLKGGGNIVIEETEALTAIDVNTGRNVRFRGQGEAILNTNLTAAVEIPKQLRLRKISGIIIVDFVDMINRDHQKKLVQVLQTELKKDRVSSDYVDMTRLGLAEITRKRTSESLADMLTD